MNRTRKLVTAVAATLVGGAALFSTAASAGGNVGWSVSVGAPGIAVTAGAPAYGGYGRGYGAPYRPYYRPYYRPAPVVYRPYVAPYPVYAPPRVVYTPRPVVYAAPPVTYYSPYPVVPSPY
jgi:hypothetical protein